MAQLVKSYIRRFQKAHRKTRRWCSVLFVLACFVVVGVFWQLHTTGIAMINETDCGLTEHTHSDACYEDVLVCNILASSTHTHTTDCYERRLVCGMEEHIHTAECIIDTTADVESAEDWEATLPELTGVWADDVVAIAESQLGYAESTANFALDEDSTAHKGYTRYGEWAENLYGDWDGMFAMFCLSYAGISEEDYPTSAGANAWVIQLQEYGAYVEASAASPQVGDLVFFNTDEDTDAERVGILTAIDAETLTVVQGDYAETEEETDAVCQVEYTVGDAAILGYGMLPTQPEGVVVATETTMLEVTEVAADSNAIQEEVVEEATEAETEAATEEENLTVAEKSSVRLMGAASEYKEENTFYLFVHLNDGSNLGPTTWVDASTGFTGALTNVLSYVDDEDSETYYLIPVTELENVSGLNYTFDPTSTENSHFKYDPNANGSNTLSDATETGVFEYVSKYDEENDGDSTNSSSGWYLRVQDTGIYNGDTTPRSNVYYIPPTYQFVLNLANNTGDSASSNDYTTSKTNNDLRYTINLSGYVSGSTATITLPSNNDVNATFTVYNDNAGNEVMQTLESVSSKYNYKLVGWYNIATGEYYDVSGGSVDVEIDFNDNNVFYADWIAESYDNASSTDTNSGDLKTDVESTSSFITIHMYDYNELFNLYSASLSQTGITKDEWTDSENMYNTPILSNDTSAMGEIAKRIGSSFIFFNNDTWTGSTLGNVSNRKDWNKWTGLPTTAPGSGGPYQDLLGDIEYDTDSELLRMLFDPSEEALGVHYVGTGDYLFSFDSSTGYYTFDSSKNTAVYNQTNKRFYVYNTSNSNAGSFLPYNDNAEYGQANGNINYWFGMDMQVDFYLPNDTATGGNQIYDEDKDTYSDMIFDFSGDDDIWIFVDGELVLDMGGDHSAVQGSINFSTGEYTIKNAQDAEYASGTIEKISAGTHTLKVYYIERGGGASNLAITCNIIPDWNYEKTDVNTVQVTKQWVDESGEPVADDDTASYNSVTMGLFKAYAVSDLNVDTNTNTYSMPTTSGTVTGGVGTSVTIADSYTLDDSGTCYDDTTGYLTAYLDGDTLYVLVDTEELSYSKNDWTYTWEMLDESSEYVVQELTVPEGYRVKSEVDNLGNYTYWGVVGEDVLSGLVNDAYDNTSNFQILLTDGAQNSKIEDTTDYPTKYDGYVIYSVGDGTVATKLVAFSQKAEPITVGSATYAYGVTSDKYLAAEDLWTVVPTGETETFEVNGLDVIVPTFYLKDSNGKYLDIKLKNGSKDTYELVTVEWNDASKPTVFSYNTLGELNTSESTGLRVVINKDGTYALVDGRQTTANDNNVKVYVQETDSDGKKYKITNTLQLYEMPEAGGSGVRSYMLVGSAISGAVLVVMLRTVTRRRRKRA